MLNQVMKKRRKSQQGNEWGVGCNEQETGGTNNKHCEENESQAHEDIVWRRPKEMKENSKIVDLHKFKRHKKTRRKGWQRLGKRIVIACLLINPKLWDC